MFCLYLSPDAVVRCFSDVKMAVWISGATGRTIRLDLEISVENSGSVSSVYHQLPDFLQGCIVSDKLSSKTFFYCRLLFSARPIQCCFFVVSFILC